MNFPIDARLVVPHSSRMSLLNTVLQADENSLTATAIVRAENPFVRDGVMGAWVCIEVMAQAVAAFEGCRARMRGESPKVGFLIGSRHFTSSTPGFPVGSSLRVHIVRQYEEGGLGLFDGKIDVDASDMTAEASLSVYQPDDAQQFLLENASV